MSYSVTQESFASLTAYWEDSDRNLNWDSVFVLPAWLEVWWRVFNPSGGLHLCAVRQESDIIGIVPLQVEEDTASFAGDTDVCDYMDFVAAPGMERDVGDVLLDDLERLGINHLELRHVRPDSTVLNILVPLARNRNYEVVCRQEAVSLEMSLPSTWEDYLNMLTSKQRHEVRRKIRRLEEAGDITYRWEAAANDTDSYMDSFFRLFELSRGEKADFMTAEREQFFRSLAEATARLGMLRIGSLELDEWPVAMTMSFAYRGTMYLYNSAYDPDYSELSVGLLSKVLGIRESIREGFEKWDFLKGNEIYKHHLGGREVPLYGCRVALK